MVEQKDTEQMEWMTAAQAAQELGITSRWVRYLIERGVLVGQHLSDRVILVKRESLANYTPKRKRRHME